MSKEVVHVCDGCSSRVQGDDFPAPWKHARIKIDYEDHEADTSVAHSTGYFDLCDLCAAELDRRIDLTTWPRNSA